MKRQVPEGWLNSHINRFKPSDPARNNAKWSDQETADLVRFYLRGISIKTLAMVHQRKVNSLEIRLSRAASLIGVPNDRL